MRNLAIFTTDFVAKTLYFIFEYIIFVIGR